jgi:hypothetical protein
MNFREEKRSRLEIQLALHGIRGPKRRQQWRLVEAVYTG